MARVTGDEFLRIIHHHLHRSAGLAREQLFRIIRDAGKIPVERDALYNVIRVWDREAVPA